jgi:uncharacterized protein (TIGR02453 family)
VDLCKSCVDIWAMGFTEAYYEFFIELALNNQKTWFDVNRARYEADVKKPFLAFVTQLLEKVAAVDSRFSGLDAKSCIFRINKDIRFSKDKTPYKLHCSAAIQLGGRKEMSAGGMYLEFGPEHCAIYSGIYMPERDGLQQIRERIAGNLKGFSDVIGGSDFVKYFGEVRGEKNKRLPAELVSAAVQQPLIYNKQFYVFHALDAEDTLAADFDDYVLKVWQAAYDYNRFLAGEY